MVEHSCQHWQQSSISLALVIEIFRSLFMVVIMLSTLKKIKKTLTKRWRRTLGEKNGFLHTETYRPYFYYHINWWCSDVSNNMLNTRVSLYPLELFIWGKDGICARFMTLCFLDMFRTLNHLPDKIIHHVWNLYWQEHREWWILPWSHSNFTKGAAPVPAMLRANDW